MRDIVLIIHDIRSTHNVGSLLRTAECMGVSKAYLTGYTPYPQHDDDTRLPHIAAKLTQQIHKTALGAEEFIAWEHHDDVRRVIDDLKHEKYTIVALEQCPQSMVLPSWIPSDKIAILLGREVEGVEAGLLELCDLCVEIPQLGEKESLNVVQATAMALYHARFAPFV